MHLKINDEIYNIKLTKVFVQQSHGYKKISKYLGELRNAFQML